MKSFAKSVAAIAVLAVASAAHAVPVSVTSVTLLAPAASVTGTLSGAPFMDGAGLLGVNTAANGSFLAFCIELNVGLPSAYPSAYDYVSYSVDSVERLLTLFARGSYSAVATQVAIWEAVYDSIPGSLGSGTFTLNAPAGVITEATTMLAAAAALQSGSYPTTGYYALRSERFQDLVVAVPEPSTYALLLAGLAGIGFIARRRSQDRG